MQFFRFGHPRALLGAIGALFFACAITRAQTVVMVSNLSQPGNGSVPVAYYPPDDGPASHYDAAQGFTTGPAASLLQAITLSVGGGSGSGFSVALYSDASGLPGSLIETLNGSSSPASAGSYSYTSGGSAILTANTSYWWIASVPDGAGSFLGFNLNSTNSTSETSAFGWTAGDVFRQQQNGGGWGPSGQPLLFSVSASAIPEPGTYAAWAGAAVLGLAVVRRRRSR